MIGIVREPVPGATPLARDAVSAPVVDTLSAHYYVRIRELDGKWTDITDRVEDVVHIDRGAGETSRVDMPINNFQDWALSNEAILRKGARVKVSYGYPGNMRDDLEFTAKEHKATSKSASLTAYERKRSKRSRHKKSRTWYDKTRSEVVREVLTGHGTDASALHIEATTEKLASITQAKEHEWEFAERLAKKEGFELWADEGGVYWKEPERAAPPTHLFRYVKGVAGVGIIKDYSIDSFGAGVPGRVVLYGRDPRTKKSYKVEGSDTSTRNLVEVVDSDDIKTPDAGDQFDDGDSGFEIERSCGSRTEHDAQRLADAIYKSYKYNALKLNLTVFLAPEMRTFTNVLVVGLGPSLDGIYSLRNCTNSMKAKESTLALRRGGRKKKGGTAGDSLIDNLIRAFNKITSGIKTPEK